MLASCHTKGSVNQNFILDALECIFQNDPSTASHVMKAREKNNKVYVRRLNKQEKQFEEAQSDPITAALSLGPKTKSTSLHSRTHQQHPRWVPPFPFPIISFKPHDLSLLKTVWRITENIKEKGELKTKQRKQ